MDVVVGTSDSENLLCSKRGFFFCTAAPVELFRGLEFFDQKYLIVIKFIYLSRGGDVARTASVWFFDNLSIELTNLLKNS